MKKFLTMIDKKICEYLGLNIASITINCIETNSHEIVISSTESFRRHLYKEKWQQFIKNDLSQVNSINKEKLGVAMGKMFADNLLISFDEICIKREKENA